MYPELVTRSDLEVFLPPIGGQTLYIFGNPRDLANPRSSSPPASTTSATAPTCSAPTSAPAGPTSRMPSRSASSGAQRGGVGLIAYSRKEGRALGEVTKFLVYNARKRQVGGDTADQYFARTECVAGVQDMRFQELMPDVFHWLGIRKIHRLVSMSNMKFDAITGSGIEIGDAGEHPRRTDPGRRPGRDGRQDGGRLLHARRRCPTPRNSRRPRAGDSTNEQGQLRARPRPAHRQRRACGSADADGHVDPALEFVDDTTQPAGAAAFLRTTAGRARPRGALLARARAGESEWFTIGDDDALEDTARTRGRGHARALPWGPIPYHSRWRHFEAGGVNRLAALDQLLGDVTRAPARPRPHRPGAGQRAARRRRRPRLALRRGHQRPALHALRGAGRRELPCLHQRPVLVQPRPPAAGRCRGPARPGDRPAGRRLPGQRRSTRWSGWRAAPRCCAGWAKRCASSPRPSATTAGPAACSMR